MDHFAEYMVKKQPDRRDVSKRILILLLAAVLVVITVFATLITRIPLILLITCGVVYGAYWLLSSLSVEYEYAVTNGEMDVDKIIARRKRVRLISVEIAKFDAYGAYTDDVPDDENRTLVLCADNTGEGEYYADLETEQYGATRIVFTPNEAVCACIEAALPRQLRRPGKEA